ncbi:MAG: helix-turn-helix domain-containing protein [Candidatus Binatia bacterium]
MITNDRQYKITRLQAAKFREALAAAPSKGLHPAALKAMRDGAQSQLNELDEQIAEYETLRDGDVSSIAVDSIEGIGVALIKARIARKLTHKALAERMQLAEQQVQRDEATFYEGASIRRLQEVANALNLRINEVITLEKE